MNKNTIIIATLTFLVGFFANSFFFSKDFDTQQMHKMPDSKMMHNNHMDMKSMMHDMNASLVGKTGDELDKNFIDEMIVHHEGAVDMAEYILKETKRPELIQLSNEIITAQNKEIEMMKKWRSEWFVN